MREKIKILYTIPNFNTAGSGIALMKLINGLDKDRFDVHIAVNHTKGRFFEDVVVKSGYPIHVIEVSKPQSQPVKGFLNMFRVARFFKKNKFDIVYSYSYTSDFWEGAAARLTGCKWIWVKKNQNWFGSSQKYWKLRTFFANRISSENTYFLNNYFKNAPKAFLNPISIDTDEFYPREKDLSLLKELGLSTNDKIILSLSNMVRRKSVETLIKAIMILKKRGPLDFKCIIKGGGDPEYVAELKAMTNEFGLQDTIMFAGPSFDTYRYYSIADLFVITSTSEAGPATVLESMASGVITLGTKVGGMLDRLAEFPEQLCEPENAEELSAKIDRFLHLSDEEKESISNHEVEVVRAKFSLNDEIKRHTQMYEELMK